MERHLKIKQVFEKNKLMNKKINKLQEILKINFKDPDLLIKSITHKSYDKKNNYEKLEFLGDRVLGLTISRKLIDL